MMSKTQNNPSALSQGAVLVIDDDQAVRLALSDLFASVGLSCETYASAAAFRATAELSGPHCIVLDVRMPGQSGLDLQGELAAQHSPIIFITGHGDVAMSVRAMKAGAFDFLAKPFNDQDLLDSVYTALERSRRWCAETDAESRANTAYASLNEREKQVVTGVVAGRLNKQIAGELGVSEITVKLSRSQAMRKLGVGCLPELVRLIDRLQAPARAEYT